jgi:NADH:ubiquinone oxidoreductase subunit 5 (subunit L)/multisubunit Na+/H+ antiporter MnhA subunit
METLGGLAKTLPWTNFFMLIGSMAITALPPLNGFISEFIIFFGLFTGLTLTPLLTPVLFTMAISGLALVGALAILGFTKAYGIVFLGLPRQNRKMQGEEFALIFPLAILAGFALALGLFPQLALKLLLSVQYQLVPQSNLNFFNNLIGMLNSISLLMFVLLAGCGGIYVLKIFLLNKKVTEKNQTWCCGYQNPNPKMQYTGSSYVNTFLQLINPIMKTNTELKRPAGFFPAAALFKSNYKDIFNFYLINPLMKAIQNVLNILHWIQSGDMQQYIIYGLLFLLFLLIWIFGTS